MFHFQVSFSSFCFQTHFAFTFHLFFISFICVFHGNYIYLFIYFSCIFHARVKINHCAPSISAALICPVSYEDPFEVWPRIQTDILDRLPLDSVQYRNPISSTVTTIGKLPIRFLSSSNSIFKDSEHPFRWFLSAYAHIYFLQAETADSYKAVKQTLKQWVETHNTGIKRYVY